jgi:uncharacterized membrane protein
MKNQETMGVDWLSALTVIGRILIVVPVSASLVAILYFALSGGGGFTGSPTDMFIFGTIILCGLVILIYVAIKRFQRRLQGKD